MNSLEHNRPWPFDPIPDLEEMEKERCNKYPFGRYDKVFIKVPRVKVDDVENWSREPPSQLSFFEQLEGKEKLQLRSPKPTVSTQAMVGHRTEKSYLMNLNDQLIALFKVEGKIYAIRDSCPHAGGPLSVGDIEEIPGAGACVRCPWHQWRIQLKDGMVRTPFGRKQQAVVYPVNVTSDGDIYVGFDSLSKKFFNLDLHPGVDRHA